MASKIPLESTKTPEVRQRLNHDKNMNNVELNYNHSQLQISKHLSGNQKIVCLPVSEVFSYQKFAYLKYSHFMLIKMFVYPDCCCNKYLGVILKSNVRLGDMVMFYVDENVPISGVIFFLKY